MDLKFCQRYTRKEFKDLCMKVFNNKQVVPNISKFNKLFIKNELNVYCDCSWIDEDQIWFIFGTLEDGSSFKDIENIRLTVNRTCEFLSVYTSPELYTMDPYLMVIDAYC
jgi:hypothetical protein